MFDAIPHKNKPKAKQKTINAVDLFCGAGGTSTGLIDAVNSLGYSIKLTAINHWDVAIATHSKNHEEVEHYCQSIESVNPTDVIKGGRLQLLVASPECTHHSNARGGKPRSDQKRADAWLLLRWIEKLYVENILIENVKEFESWGPLNAKGLPDKRHKGILFRQFIDTLRSFNYNVEWKVLNCADYGDPTTRERLFVIARRPKHKPIVWPERTHASRKELVKMAAQPDLFGESARQLKPWVAAREIIDWSLEGKSIFGRKKPLSPNTMRRIFKGLEKHGLKNFLVNLKNADRRDRSVDEPTFTQATANHQAVVEPFIVPQNSAPPTRDIDEPVPTLTTTSRGVGVVEVEPFTLSVERAQTNRSGPRPVEEPVATITGSPRIGIVEGEIQPFTISAGGPKLPAQSTDEPLRTILTRDHQAIIEAFLIKFHGGENAENRNYPVEEPLGTLDTSNRFGLVEPFLIKNFGNGDEAGYRSKPIEDPLGTVCAQRNHHGLVEADAFLLGQQSGAVARDVDEPVPTVAGKGAIGKVDVDPFLVLMKNNQHSGSVDDPLQTLTTKESYAIAEPYIIKFFGNGENVDSIDDPLSTVTAKDRFALCIPSIGIALDIRFRMLQPHELAAAMSFPKDYEFTGNREAKVKQIGNAVPLRTSKALCKALLS
jgi:DNA (cytosine-5)-methyltransferase 1